MQQPGHPIVVTPQLAAIREKARSLHEQGRLAEALEVHAEALRLAPDAVGIWLSAGQLAHSLNLQEVSLPHFEQAVRLDPRCFPAVDAARRICLGLGLYERALHYSKIAYELNPAPETLLGLKLLIPPIMHSNHAIRETRLRYEQSLDEVLASPLRLAGPDGVLGTSAFFLAYHGKNDRDLQIKAARMFLKAMPGLAMTAAHCSGAERRPGRIRVGFISRFFCSHSICSTTRGLIDRLSRSRFEVFALRITPSRCDQETARIRAAADRSIDLDADFYKAREQIAALELDILFYQDIGMEPTSYFLAFARLARVQCVSFGHPNTTGIPNMDYFLSNDLYEGTDAESHYSEKLYLLHDLPTLAYYYKPALIRPAAAREELGLPAAKTLYVCPQTLYKLHPDIDELLRGILLRDPDGMIVLIEGQFGEFTEQLRARFAITMPGLEHRIVFLKRMDFQRYLQLLAMADVILDSVHFNGMNTSLEAFAVATPVVTLPSELQRGRHTQAMYRKMQIFDCVAENPAHYVEIAVRIGTDADYARSLRERISDRNHVLFEDPGVIEEFERFFLGAFNRSFEGHACAV